MIEDRATQALQIAVAAVYFADSSDYKAALFEIVKELAGQEGAELLYINPTEAYQKYCE